MKAFLIGFILTVATGIFVLIGFLFFPLFLLLALLAKVIVAIVFVAFCMWLLGKFVIFVWESLSRK